MSDKRIIGIEGLSSDEVRAEVAKGGRFVIFHYCISVIILTFNRSSNVYFIKPGESAFVTGLPYTLLTLLLGWWGFPFGPIFSVWDLVRNLNGTNVNKELGIFTKAEREKFMSDVNKKIDNMIAKKKKEDAKKTW
ncbi:Uncharacterised protein [Candidatus Tiddalikarchaeum anstoanum]|nr:Uncharacterised protein [Candidatus Tiddalikarchaeum anstoanum]